MTKLDVWLHCMLVLVWLCIVYIVYAILHEMSIQTSRWKVAEPVDFCTLCRSGACSKMRGIGVRVLDAEVSGQCRILQDVQIVMRYFKLHPFMKALVQ